MGVRPSGPPGRRGRLMYVAAVAVVVVVLGLITWSILDAWVY
jgi:hypothetical protein